MAARSLSVLVLLAAASAAGATERFYPVMGPDGRLQVIRSPETPEVDAPPSARTEADGGDAEAAPTPAPGAAVAAETPAVTSAGTQQGFAPYDSGEYASSESVEGALAAEAEGKKRFYVINDAMGNRIGETEAGDGGGLLPPAGEPSALPASVTELSYPVPAVPVRLDAAAARERFPALPSCQSVARLRDRPLVQQGHPATLVLHKATYLFLDDSRVVESYRVGGTGPRTLALRAFSRSDRQPAFPHPHLAFLDEAGCVTRVVAGYFDRLYPATDERHPMLSAELMVHTEEAYVLVLATRAGGEIAAALPYGHSPYGQLKFILKK